MSGNRQERVSELIKRELGTIFQREARTICRGAMVSVTVVRVTADFSLARVYVSIFGHPNAQEVLNSIQTNKSTIKGQLGRIIGQQFRKVPALDFILDDSLDYAEEIDELLKPR